MVPKLHPTRNSSRGSDLQLGLRFADEPLHQFYTEFVDKLISDASMDCLTDSDGYEEIASNTSRPSATELIIPTPNGHGQYRSLWCELEEVKNSGILETLSPVRKCSEKLLASLKKCWQDGILLTGLCDVIYQHTSENFKIYVKYCSNQIYMDRTLKALKEQTMAFVEIISHLEANLLCHLLSLLSFLMLPM